MLWGVAIRGRGSTVQGDVGDTNSPGNESGVRVTQEQGLRKGNWTWCALFDIWHSTKEIIQTNPVRSISGVSVFSTISSARPSTFLTCVRTIPAPCQSTVICKPANCARCAERSISPGMSEPGVPNWNLRPKGCPWDVKAPPMVTNFYLPSFRNEPVAI